MLYQIHNSYFRLLPLPSDHIITFLTGMIINLNTMPSVFRWMRYISPARHGYQGLVVNWYLQANETAACDLTPDIEFFEVFTATEEFKPSIYWKDLGINVGIDAVLLSILVIIFKLKELRVF